MLIVNVREEIQSNKCCDNFRLNKFVYRDNADFFLEESDYKKLNVYN